jgi:putative redox protein
MATETVHAEWLHEATFLLRDRSGFPILMAQPMGVNGSDLLPLSIIGCASWDIVSILHKQHQQLSSLQVTAESEREEQPPWRFLAVHVHYHLRGTDLDPRLVQKAITLAEDKYCSTFATLRQALELTSEFSILSEADAEVAPG